MSRSNSKQIAFLVFVLSLLGPAVAFACDAALTATASFGPFSPNAVKTGVAPYSSGLGGFSCSSGSILTLLSGNYLKATASTTSGSFTLKNTLNSDTIAYKVAADSAGANVFTAGTPVYYINGTLINLLGLLGTSTINVPIYVKPLNATAVSAGTYTGQLTLLWQWSFCPGIGVGGLCIGTVDSGSKTTTVTINVLVQPVAPTIQIGSADSWDPVNQTSNPKAIPGGKQRVTVTVTNPDIAPMDANTLVVVVPSPAGAFPALDGDGTSGSSPFQLTQGSTSSTLVLVNPSDVSFSSDGGSTWTYSPVIGSNVSEAAITHTRLKPEGAMAAGSSFSVVIPYQLK